MGLLAVRPEDRPTAKEAREMQWVKDWDQRDVETETEGTTWATMSRRELEAELTKLKDKVKRAETEVMRLQQASTIMIESKEKEHRQAQQALEAKINELRLLMSQIRLSLNPKQEEVCIIRYIYFSEPESDVGRIIAKRLRANEPLQPPPSKQQIYTKNA